MDILSINNLYYLNVFNDLNMSLKPCGFYILLGKNCSGKSTLVELILGMHKINGNINLNLQKEQIGVVMPKSIFIKETVLENLMYPLENLNRDNIKKTVYQLINIFDINKLLYKKIEELSIGEKKLVKILISIIHNPKLIIIDDSLDDLDLEYRNKLLDYLKKISEQRCVLILTSSSDYLNYATNILLLSDGTIVKDLSFNELKNEEKLLVKMNIKIPFVFELQNKLKLYNILNEDCSNISEIVEAVWK